MLFELNAIGYLGRDAEQNQTNGIEYIRFSVAVTEKYQKDGQTIEKTYWLDCVIWRPDRYKNLVPYLKKGTMIYVSGKPDSKPYKSQDGQLKSSISLQVNKVDLLKSPTNTAPTPPDNLKPTTGNADPRQTSSNSEVPVPDFDDDLPF